MSGQVSREFLQQAMRAAGCTGDLDAALKFPALRIALENTAALLQQIHKTATNSPPRFDAKRAAAGDLD
jgi:hypothetical protein